MSDIKFNCPSCKQSLEAPPDMAGQLIDCPACKQTIEIPVAARSRPIQATSPKPTPRASVPPLPRPPTPPTDRPAPTKRHGIFYYVFWGTVSLFATLAILAVGLFFFTAFGAGFLAAFKGEASRSTTSVHSAARMLPPLTATETEQAARLRASLESETDKVEGTTWYSPRVADGYKTAVYLYIGQKGTDAWLRWKIRYYGDDWLFIRKYRVKIDEAEPTTLLPTRDIKHDNSGGSVWETFDESAIEHAHVLNQIMNSQTTLLRMEGTEGVKDVTLDSTDLQRLRDVLLVYRSLGGQWPAE